MKQLQKLSGKRILVTAGPTREWIDPFRFISNPSSGKMGFALARASLDCGALTTLIHGPVSTELLETVSNAELIRIETTQDMFEAVTERISDSDILVMAAAPSDYSPIIYEEHKIKKTSEFFTLQLKRNPDILKHVSEICRKNLINCILVGFAAETENIHEYALKKMDEKKLDLICLNDIRSPGSGFNADTNSLTVYTRKGERYDIPLMSKYDAAVEILSLILSFLHN